MCIRDRGVVVDDRRFERDLSVEEGFPVECQFVAADDSSGHVRRSEGVFPGQGDRRLTVGDLSAHRFVEDAERPREIPLAREVVAQRRASRLRPIPRAVFVQNDLSTVIGRRDHRATDECRHGKNGQQDEQYLSHKFLLQSLDSTFNR